MSKIQASTNIETENNKDPKSVPKFVDLFFQDVVRVVNGGLDFATNFNAKTVTVPFTVANENTTVIHGLGRVPAGYLVVGLSTNMIIYDGSVAGTTSAIVLKSSAIGNARILVY